MDMRTEEHESRIDVSDMPITAHNSRIPMPDIAHDLRTKALTYILFELQAAESPPRQAWERNLEYTRKP
jgi:hypothetical protein